MSESNSQILEMYAHPATIQAKILTDMQNRLTGGRPIVSGNNVCSFLIESFAQISSDVVREVANEFEALYPRRAQTAEQLYKHMSNYDYVGLFATPARVYIQLVLRKDQLVRDALDFNDNYKKVVIPKNSEFLVDQYRFSLYYPIEIKINKRTNTIIVSYDTTENNPLHTLTQNTLEHRISTIHGLEMVAIQIPVYQFRRQMYVENIMTNASFAKKYSFPNKFYAARIFTNNDPIDQDKWYELDQTLADDVYDPATITAQLTVDPQNNTLAVSIPQVYLTEEKLGNKLRIELLTTDGSVDADISNIQEENISATFTPTGIAAVDKYVQFLARPETIIVAPTSKKIIGGSNGLSFESLRQRVIHNSFHGGVLLTPRDLDNHFADIGFKITKYQDNITRRIYIAHKELTDLNGVISAAANIPSTFTLAMLDDSDNYSTINNNNDQSFTILPTTVYKYSGLFCTPLTNAERAVLTGMSREELVAELNDNTYTINPFHVRIDTTHRYPMAYTYDFTSPDITSVEFLGENINVSTQLSVFSASITHPIEGVGGFTIELEVIKTADIVDVPSSDIVIVAVITTEGGVSVFQEAVYDRTEGGLDIYIIHLETDYDINREHKIDITSLSNGNGSYGHLVNLTTDIGLVFMIRKSIIDYGPTLVTNIGHSVADFYPDFIALAEQSIKTVFGSWVQECFTRVDMWAKDEVYQTYEVREELTYPSSTYVRDVDGNIVYDGEVNPVYIPLAHIAGDVVTTDETVLITEDNAAEYHYALVVGTRTVLSALNEDDYIDSPDPVKLVIIQVDYEERVDVMITALNVADYYDAEIYGSETVITAENEADYYNTLVDLKIPTVLHNVGDPVLTVDGYRIKVTDRELQYNIDMTHVNKKLTHSENPAHAEYFKSIASQLRSYYMSIQESRLLLIEETELYFRPLRSLGLSKFRISANSNISLDLELSMKFKLYVLPHIIEDRRLLTTIKDTVISIIDEHVKSGVISVTAIAENIRKQMPQMVSHVDVLGINEDGALQTLIPLDSDVVPSLKQRLYIADDGSIDIERALDITYVTVDPPNQTQSA